MSFNRDYPQLTAYGEIPYYIGDPSTEMIQNHTSVDGSHLVVKAEVAFDDYGAWRIAMLGTSYIDDNGLLRRVPPERIGWPLDVSAGGEWQLYCTEISITRIGGNAIKESDNDYIPKFRNVPQPIATWNNWPRPRWVECQCTFQALKYAVFADDDATWLGYNNGNPSEWNRFTIFRERPSSENEKVPVGSVGYFRNNVFFPINETFFRRTNITRVELKWLGVPEVPETNILNCSGKVNDIPFQIFLPSGGIRTYDTGKLLYDTLEIEPVHGPDGEVKYNITYFFVARTDGRSWNMFYDPQGNLVELFRKSLDNTGQTITGPVFESADLTSLFRYSA